MLTIDSSGVLAFYNRREPAHDACRLEISRQAGPVILPAATLAELDWAFRQRLGVTAERAFLHDLADELWHVSWHARDATRIAVLSERYRDLPLGITDAAVVACAERSGGDVLSIDRRHFDVVERGEGTIVRLPRVW